MDVLSMNNQHTASRYRMTCGIVFGLLMNTLLATTANAQWTGGLEGGTVIGDSRQASTRLRGVLRNDTRPLSHYIFAEWIDGNDAGDSYSLGYNPRFWFSQTNYAFGESRFRIEQSLGIDREFKLIGGVGSQLINEQTRSLFVEAGVGGRSITFDDLDDDTTTEGLAVARLGGHQTIADAVKLDLSLSGTQSSDDVLELDAEVGLSVRIGGGAVRVGYRGRSIKVGDFDSVSDDDTFVSFNYGF